jgi:hypothetical protein
MSVKQRKRKHFSMEETCTLLDIWSDSSIQRKFLKLYKHDLIWEEISQIMTNLGFNRSKQECCNRVNNLKRQFAKIRKTVECGKYVGNITMPKLNVICMLLVTLNIWSDCYLKLLNNFRRTTGQQSVLATFYYSGEQQVTSRK